MVRALLLPSVALVLVLLAGFTAAIIARSACLRGMGRSPMFGLSRAAGPLWGEGAPAARLSLASRCAVVTPAASWRAVKRSVGTRGTAQALPWPQSSLDKQRAAGAHAS